jgi:IS5 family transposase
MIIDRALPDRLEAMVPSHMRRTDPVLATLDPLLDDDVLFGQVKADLCRRHPHSATSGRHSTPVEVILRMLVVRRLYDWSYEDTERFVWDSLSLRHFCRIGQHPVPDDTTLLRWANCLRPETIEQLHARVVDLARERQVTRGRKLRIDGTVVETTMHYPRDSALLADAGRMVGRLLQRAQEVVGAEAPASLFRNWTRSTKRLAREIGEAARKRGAEGKALRTKTYGRLLHIVGTVQRQAQEVVARLQRVGEAGDRIRTQLEALLPLVAQVMQQTTRRVAGEQVPAGEKLVSLTEPHTAIIKRDKAGQQTEFGHKVLLDEVEGGISSDYVILKGNAAEAPQVVEQVKRHRARFGTAPRLVATDRGGYAPGTEEALQLLGVTRVVIPVPGKPPPERKTLEHTRWFRQGQRFRAGIEGRISVCKRRGWLGRCRDHGQAGFARWIGWGVIANNLVAMAADDVTKAQQEAA